MKLTSGEMRCEHLKGNISIIPMDVFLEVNIIKHLPLFFLDGYHRNFFFDFGMFRYRGFGP